MEVIGEDGISEDMHPAIVGHLPKLPAEDFLCGIVEQTLAVHRPGHAMVNSLALGGGDLDARSSHGK
jgi:hypothetical protein